LHSNVPLPQVVDDAINARPSASVSELGDEQLRSMAHSFHADVPALLTGGGLSFTGD
jgi:hypothetical protein